MAPAATNVSYFKKNGRAELDWTVYTYIWQPGECKRLTFWSRCCPWALFRGRPFYSKRVFLGPLCERSCKTSNEFFSQLIDHVTWLGRMWTCASLLSAHAHKYTCKSRRPHMHNNSTRDKGVSERSELTPCIILLVYGNPPQTILCKNTGMENRRRNNGNVSASITMAENTNLKRCNTKNISSWASCRMYKIEPNSIMVANIREYTVYKKQTIYYYLLKK